MMDGEADEQADAQREQDEKSGAVKPKWIAREHWRAGLMKGFDAVGICEVEGAFGVVLVAALGIDRERALDERVSHAGMFGFSAAGRFGAWKTGV